MKKSTKRLIIKIIVIAGIVFLVNQFLITLYRMNGNSMFPAIRDGDLCFLLKTEKPKTDDIVLWKDNEGKKHLSRVIAVSGQTVEFNDTGVVINGYPQAESIFYETVPTDDVSYPLTVDGYFVMNDFRSDVSDSRTYNNIKDNQIIGKIFFIFRRRGF